MKEHLLRGVLLVVGIVLALAAAELMAICWLYLEDGQYTAAADLFERTQNTYVHEMTKGTDCRYIDTLYPHPYVAFVHHANPPCGVSWVNNVGLFGPDFPTVKPTDRYVVMLTGGSVASFLGGNQQAPRPNYLEEELNNHYVSPTGQPWRVMDAAAGAWKEPQTFIIFALYATAVDAVVDLSGFNEQYYFGPGNLNRLEAPASNFLEANPFAADDSFGDAAIGWVMGRVAGALAVNPVLRRSHAAYVAVRAIESAARGRDIFESDKPTTIKSLFALPKEVRDNPERLFNVQLGLYQKYFRATEALADDYGVKSAFFLQPVPAWGKALTTDEKRVVGDISYGDRYRKMVQGMLLLREHGTAIYDLGSLFEGEKGTVYADDIHYVSNTDGVSPGYRLVAARMAELLAESWSLKRK